MENLEQNKEEKQKIENQQVSYEQYRKVLDQRKADQEKAKEYAAKLAEFEAEKKAREEEEAKKRGEFENLLKLKEQELLDAKTESQKSAERVATTWKLNAVNSALAKEGAKIRKHDYFSFVDFSKINFDHESMKVDDESLKSVVSEFVSSYPDLIERESKGTIPAKPADRFDANSLPKTKEEKSELMKAALETIMLKH